MTENVDPPTRPAVSVVVVAYNSATTLQRCLETLTPQVAALDGELVVVDNASNDASAELARDAGVQVIRSKRNLGFAGGCNLGVRATTGDVIVLVNPDAELDSGALPGLVDAAARDRNGPVGGRARHADGTYDPRSTLGRPSLRGAMAFSVGLDKLIRGSRIFDPEYGMQDIPLDAGVIRVEAVSGAVMAVARALWSELGGLDERYFVYGEDVDLCLRAASSGRHPVVVAGAGYQHVGGVSTEDSTLRLTLLFRGKVELYNRHLTPFSARIAVAALQLGTFIRGVPVGRWESAAKTAPATWLSLFRARRSWREGHSGAEVLP